MAEPGPKMELETSTVEALPGRFPATQWSVVLAAGENDVPRALIALEQLCQRYWLPIYAHVRRSGHSPHDAEDLTQSFFAHLLEKGALKRADQAKGKFRSFLLGSLKFYLSNEQAKERAQKRGGRQQFISLDDQQAEQLYSREPVDGLSPDRIFERQWAWALIHHALDRLRSECELRGEARLFAVLEPSLLDASTPGVAARLSRDLGLNEGAVRVAVHRLRRRFGEVLRREVGETVTYPEQVEEEIRQLFASITTVR